AAIYAGRLQLKTLLVGEKIGGTIMLTDEIANYPGFKKITGLELFRRIKEHAQDYDIEIMEKRAESIERQTGAVRNSTGVPGSADGNISNATLRSTSGAGVFEVATKDERLKTKTVIIATGTHLRKLGVPGEDEFANRGVHYCALCDGALYKNKVIGVVGGSDSAATEALLLSEYAEKVFIIYRKEKIRAEPVTAQRVERNKKIEIINNTNVTEMKGDKFLHSVILDKPYKGSNELKLDALFIQVGQIPLSDLAVAAGVKINQKKEIIINRDSETNIAGIFACGDVVDGKFKQAITGVAQAVTAAHSAYEYIANLPATE
ncbi:MAG TPA: FAD-dependent oxidoreductase, partial [Sedimentisphaerales bacterium]|nr:FAD-dependent oxidoreductase [Sedimentisphaerales bacterium]